MGGIHFQTPIPNWPNAINRYPPGTWHKSVQDQHLCRDIKAHTGGQAQTVFRWPVPQDNYDPYLNRPNKDGARAFFANFVDGTFLQLAAAGAFNAVETFNEVYGNGQNEDERTAFINFELDAVDVWIELQAAHPELRTIKLCLANIAIGNDIPDEIAEAAHRHGHYMGYHSYIPTLNKQILAGEWEFYSGRWAFMDARWRARGWFVKWLGTEGGPVGYHVGGNGDIHLQGGQGWRYPSVCNRDMAAYQAVLSYWLNRTAAWNKQHGNRHRGMVLFTTSTLNDQWGHFQHTTSELESLGDFMAAWGPQPPVDPPSPPPSTIRKYKRTVNLLPQNATLQQALDVMKLAHANKQSVVWSADDTFMNPDPEQAELTGKTAIVWGDVPGGTPAALEAWVTKHYAPKGTITYKPWPVPAFEFKAWPSAIRTGGVIMLGPYANKGLNQLWGENPDNYEPFGLPGHEGLDFHLLNNGPVFVVAGGVVELTDKIDDGNYGKWIRVRHANGYTTSYAHLNDILVAEGDNVQAGQLIGLGGSTGNSTGPHLHLTLKRDGHQEPGDWPEGYVNPMPALDRFLGVNR